MNQHLFIPPTASPRPNSRGQSRAMGGSRAQFGGVGGQPQPSNPLKDRLSNINTPKKRIDKEREFDALRDKLKKEFDIFDTDKDQKVSMRELQTFLDSKVPNSII